MLRLARARPTPPPSQRHSIHVGSKTVPLSSNLQPTRCMSFYNDLRRVGMKVEVPADLGEVAWNVHPSKMKRQITPAELAELEKQVPPVGLPPVDEPLTYLSEAEKKELQVLSSGPLTDEEAMGHDDRKKIIVMTQAMEKANYVVRYHEYMKDLRWYNYGLNVTTGHWEEVRMLPQLFAWFTLKKDDLHRKRYERRDKRYIRKVYRDSQMFVKGKLVYKLAYHFTLPIMELQRSYAENMQALQAARVDDDGLCELENRIIGATQLKKKIGDLVDRLTQKVISMAPHHAMARQFHIPSGRFNDFGFKEERIKYEEEIPALPAVATVLPPAPIQLDPQRLAKLGVASRLPEVDPDPVPELPEEEKQLQWGKYHEQRRRNMMFPYKSLKEGILGHRRQSPVLRERHNIDDQGRWLMGRDNYQYRPLEYTPKAETKHDVEMADSVIDYNDKIWAEPPKPFPEMTQEEKVDYIKNNFSNWQFIQWWRYRQRTIHRKRRKRKRGRRRRKLPFGFKRKVRKHRRRMRKLMKRVTWGALRRNLDPKFHSMFFKKSVRKYFVPILFNAMSNNFSKMHVIRAMCGPYLYNRIERMRNIMEYQQVTSYMKLYRIGKMTLGRRIHRINGLVYFTIKVLVWAHYWIRDKDGRTIAGSPGRLRRQLWKLKVYRDPGAPSFMEHDQPSKGRWRVGSLKRRRLRVRNRSWKSPAQRASSYLKSLLDLQEIPYSAPHDYDMYKDQDFLAFGEDIRVTHREKNNYQRLIDDFVNVQLGEKGMTREEWEEKTGLKQIEREMEAAQDRMDAREEELRAKQRGGEEEEEGEDEDEPVKDLDPETQRRMIRLTAEEHKFETQLWGGHFQEMEDAVTEADGRHAWESYKQFKKNPIKETFEIRRKAEEEHVLTNIHQDLWETWTRSNRG
ncbi:hypothetical protein PROFUN_08041 [Planoprotostelium fungivorum]|uniref:Uncharacterized protein n=1 Tax=Planoprotostelium fungivorum TaxID=1890364 RepID=A0A2P6NKJ2_9EUKA|nr:hypothetical protein PROFUN_08041 [Planoprotostelium fungivorum]